MGEDKKEPENKCIFCKIVKGEIPSTKIFENKYVLAFLDILPAAKGHTLVIPKEHYQFLHEIPEDIMAELARAVQKVGPLAQKVAVAEGYNLLLSNGEAAGQEINHAHFHIIPRKKDDNLSLAKWEQGSAEKEELEQYAELIRGQL